MTDIHADPAVAGTRPTARVEVIVSRGLPESGEPTDIIGYWPEHVRTEARKRGYYPMVRIAWPEEFELLWSARAAQFASQVAQASISQDPVVRALTSSVVSAAPKNQPPPERSRDPFLMKIEDYADRTGYSTTFIKRLIPRGLPVLGRHKARRVHVARADRWLEENLDHLDISDSTDVVELAKANARRSTKRAS